MVPTESSASHQGETFVQETEATIYDYKGALVFWSTNGSALSEAFPSLERGVENEDTRLSFYTKSKILTFEFCKTNLFSYWQCIVFVMVFSIQELNA